MLTSLILQILGLFKLALFIRIIIDYIRMFAKNWRPNSILLAFFEFIYSITDPPMRYVQRFVPPLRLGGISLDLSIIVLLIAVNLLQGAVRVIL
ncbi:COG0762 Predicted integral membrane protein [Candidatus Nanopelagicaceae bacterium]